jgi:ribonuclease R
MAISADDLMKPLLRQRGTPLSGRQILSQFQLSRTERQEAMRLLETLADEGLLRRVGKSRYALTQPARLVIGRVSAHREGYGFVVPESGDGQDVFVPARFMREVMHGDRVAVRVERSPRGGREGRVVRVLERAWRKLVGSYEPHGGSGYVVPADPLLSQAVLLSSPAAAEVRPGYLVVVAIERYPDRRHVPMGSIVEVLGDPTDPRVEILAVAHKYDLPREFSPGVEAAARAVARQVQPEELEGRQDLRSLSFVTIDGESAKDFDDAVAVRSEKGGTVRLWVAIADVAHYVAQNSPMDREALERGTSVYFPGTCLPMLPEPLSNGICSLKPDVDRLTLAAEMLFDSSGSRLEQHFYPAVIRSRARLTYRQVAEKLETPEDDATCPNEGWAGSVRIMAQLAERLRDMRFRRGSLDFDLPEPEIVLDLQGRPDQIVRAERTPAHRLIEEFMLAANEAVAEFLTERGLPLLYRIHEPPELAKLQAFQEFLGHFNYGMVLDEAGPAPQVLQDVLEAVRGRPEERMINQVLLRSMKQARYSADNDGHFGLAAACYCHFTSPIRRYPDLIVHRILRRVLAGRAAPLSHQRLAELGELTSQRERRAMEAEREIVALKRCQFMADKVGDMFDGLVSGVQPFGFFVELTDVFVEGLVHIATLNDDYYEFEEELHRLVGQRRRRMFRIGDAVRVQLVRVDPDRRELDFQLEENLPPAAVTGSGRRRAGRRR